MYDLSSRAVLSYQIFKNTDKVLHGYRHRIPPKKKKMTFFRIVAYILFSIFAVSSALVISSAIYISYLSFGLPDVHEIDQLYIAESTTIYDRNGNVLYIKHGDENRKNIEYQEISPHLINATIAIEDDQFWNHKGFDLPGIAKAAMYEFFGTGTKRGGSTITQQYVKNAFLSRERSYDRKIKELILAVRLEEAYDKKTIMKLYLNKIPYGNNAYGIQKAAETYFNKNANELNIAQSAILASLPQAPSLYNPYGPNRESKLVTPLEDLYADGRCSPDALVKDVDYTLGLIGMGFEDENCEIFVKGRADIVLKKMHEQGYITTEEKNQAWEEIHLISFNDYIETIDSPHFVFYVIQELEEKYGKQVVEQGGLQVYTTLDPDLQNLAEDVVYRGVNKNVKWFNANNGALVSLDPDTGEIMAMVGSKDYYNQYIDGNVNIATSYRQPGSSFKPYVYAQAFYNRYSPATIVNDSKTKFGNATPNNYDGKFLGPMTIRRALAQSRNIPAIHAYYWAGEQGAIIDLAKDMGIKFLSENRNYGWTLALGTAEVRLLDHTAAYGAFANGGKEVKPLSILKIVDGEGKVIEEFDPEKEKKEVLDPQIAYLITSILSDEKVRLGPNMTIPGFKNAAKTGTSNKKVWGTNIPSNLWTMGYTTHLVTGVWSGNSNDRKSGNLFLRANGYEAAAPIWKEYMVKAHEMKDFKPEEFQIPPGIKFISINPRTGKTISIKYPTKYMRTDVFASFSYL